MDDLKSEFELIKKDILSAVKAIEESPDEFLFCTPNPLEYIKEKLEEFENKIKNYSTEYLLKPIKTAPRDGRYILVAGPSGFRSTPLRFAVCKWDANYRPHSPWQTHSHDSFTDDGEEPTHWMEIPKTNDFS